MHPATPWLLGLYALAFLLDLVPWHRFSGSVWWLWHGPPVVLGATLDQTRGVPACDDFPDGLRTYWTLQAGIFLVAVRIVYFAGVPKESRLTEAEPGGPGNEPPTPSTHGEEGTEEGRS